MRSTGHGKIGKAWRLDVAVRRFRRDEGGALLLLGMMLLFMMLIVSSLAIDFMRTEHTRIRQYNTLDRAILAAADLDQKLDPEAVVRDYFDKAGLSALGAEVRVYEEKTGDGALTLRRVTATASTKLDTLLMRLAGVPTLNVAVGGAAEESVDDVEISLVLDISGSMRETVSTGETREELLREAAKRFIEIVLEGRAQEVTSINVIPYAGGTNPGPELFSLLGGVRTHTNSSCIELTESDFNTANPPPMGRGQVPHFMKWAIAPTFMDWGWCPQDQSAIKIATNDRDELKDFLDTFRLHDGTGTHIGLKWGLTLLNPSMRSTFSQLAADGEIPTTFANRPSAWPAAGADSDSVARKYIVLMTDGRITDQFRPRFTGFSDPDTDTLDNEKINGVDDPDTIDGIDYDLWNAVKEIDKQPSDMRANLSSVPNYTSYNTNVARFNAQCALAKQSNVIVYTIAFEVPGATDRQTLRNCASGTAYAFDVNGREIQNAFAAIARTINQLRLTQ